MTGPPELRTFSYDTDGDTTTRNMVREQKLDVGLRLLNTPGCLTGCLTSRSPPVWVGLTGQ